VIFQFQLIILEKEGFELLCLDLPMETGISMVPTTTVGDMEESLPFNVELLVISLCLLTITVKEK